jgi:hypothetical protein
MKSIYVVRAELPIEENLLDHRAEIALKTRRPAVIITLV